MSARIIFDKLLTKQLLRQAGVPTPHGRLVQSPDEAISFREEIGRPIVIKPRFGMKGRGVTVNLRGPNEITRAFKRANQFGDVLAEEYIANSIDYRCFATNDTCVSIVRRILPWVLGDGSSTINELIEEKNRERQECPSTVGTFIPVDARTKRHLQRSNLTLESILPDGQAIVVRDIGGLSSGGEPYECSRHISDSVKAIVAQAVAAIPGLTWAGCDVMIGPDGVAQVIEVNSDAGIGGARYPFYGTPQPIDELLFKARLATASPISTGAITPLVALEAPRPLPVSETEGDKGQVRLPSLFHTYLQATGWSLEESAKGVVRAVSRSGHEEWLRGCATIRDLDIVHRSVQRHAIVRGLLHSAGIMRPRGRMVTSKDELRNFFDTVDGHIKLVRIRRPWESGSTKIIKSYADVDTWPREFRHRWMAQGVPSGHRCWVIASPGQPLAILANPDFPAQLCATASKVGVEAVRAIPELRWGAVAIVFRKSITGSRTPLVEGVSIDPLINGNYSVIAGSLEGVWETILAE
ncbi:MAG: ATP-grasp domain-containing protein [Ancrocorticia sp.]